MMEVNFLTYGALGIAASFVGTIPVGPINISVVATTIKRNFKAGIVFSSSAAFVEILQSFIALQFGMLLSGMLFNNPSFQFAVSVVFTTVGAIFLLKKEKVTLKNNSKKKLPAWANGIIISLLNPQALPFWIFVLGYYQSASLIDMELLSLGHVNCVLSFLIGVYLGKFAALSMYSYLSIYLSSKIGQFAFWMNKILGGVFIFFAIGQLLKLL